MASRLPVSLAMCCVLIAACQPEAANQTMPPPEVTVARPLVKEITDWDEYTGRFSAVESVEIRARVSGYLEIVHFREGTIVAENELLFTIDPRPYQATLSQMEAEQTAAQVRLQLADSDQERAKRLFASRAVSEEELDARTQERRQAVAALEAAQAGVESARLNLEFTEVRSPISGRVSRAIVTRGNLVSGGTSQSTLLTTVMSIDPIHLYFTADESDYLRYVRLDREGSRPSSRDTANPVRVQLADEQGFPRAGVMDFVENRVDEASGTIEGRAIFENPDGLLTPGLFARIQLLGEGPYDALFIPDAAVLTDQSQRFVYVLGDDGLPARRLVELGRALGQLRIVRSGLDKDDRVIVNGIQRVRAGAPVTPLEGAVDDFELAGVTAADAAGR